MAQQLLLVFSVLVATAMARPLLPTMVGLAESPTSNAPTSGGAGGPTPAARRHGSSAAGGEIIVGGLATAILGVIVWYIRMTRRRHGQTTKA
ncbi:hypothetical protein QJS04_geneDACA019049 [Acorus gramineus]|uniref:Uncharacterized protein n=1 Tax=Acorus gramineus TaxID=55184 RepID=A0AAV9A8W9_ACOGR|nr:hypothetical protein QJS04_geneDACA019049 [Acorus gramineus]